MTDESSSALADRLAKVCEDIADKHGDSTGSKSGSKYLEGIYDGAIRCAGAVRLAATPAGSPGREEPCTHPWVQPDNPGQPYCAQCGMPWDQVRAIEQCDWPADGKFTFHDEPGEHDPCYVVMPGGASLAVNHHAQPGVDIARAKFIVAACNLSLSPTAPNALQPAPGGEVLVGFEWKIARTQAHLHFNDRFTGISLPIKSAHREISEWRNEVLSMLRLPTLNKGAV